jgi:hypothetical protein
MSDRKQNKAQETTAGAKVGVGRRAFIRQTGFVAGALGVAAVAGGALAPAAAADAKPEGYRETEHVKTYYKLAAF